MYYKIKKFMYKITNYLNFRSVNKLKQYVYNSTVEFEWKNNWYAFVDFKILIL